MAKTTTKTIKIDIVNTAAFKKAVEAIKSDTERSFQSFVQSVNEKTNAVLAVFNGETAGNVRLMLEELAGSLGSVQTTTRLQPIPSRGVLPAGPVTIKTSRADEVDVDKFKVERKPIQKVDGEQVPCRDEEFRADPNARNEFDDLKAELNTVAVKKAAAIDIKMMPEESSPRRPPSLPKEKVRCSSCGRGMEVYWFELQNPELNALFTCTRCLNGSR